MSDHEAGKVSSGYTVEVAQDAAFVIIYADERGRLRFAIEVDDKPKTIYLNPRPSDGESIVDVHDEATMARIRLAVGRVTAHFQAQGLKVEVD
jgi:hypothetical protein